MLEQRRRLILLACALLSPLRAAAELLEEADYRVIPQQPVLDPKRIEVVEFFYYGCRWCNEFEPYLSDWLNRKPADVLFRYQPAIKSRRWITLTKAYFALLLLGELPRLQERVYRAYHRENVNLEDESVLIDWAVKQGLRRDRFEQALQSDAVMAQVEASREMTHAYQVDTTPSVVVEGRYLTSSGMAGGVAELILSVDELVEMARKERRAAR
jgi:protein dithiol oxidoreductase (disulfide-forming)